MIKKHVVTAFEGRSLVELDVKGQFDFMGADREEVSVAFRHVGIVYANMMSIVMTLKTPQSTYLSIAEIRRPI